MPVTTVNTPIGEVQVDHPEGASDDAIMRFAKKEYERRSANREAIAASLPKYSPADTSPIDNILAGAGKFFVDSGRGIAQLFGADNQDAIDEARRLDQPLMNTKSGLVGNIAGGVAATLPLALIPGVNTVAGGAALGAGVGLTSPVATGESRAVNTALGAGGGAIGSKVGQILSRGRNVPLGSLGDEFGTGLNRAEYAALRAGQDAGFTPTPGVATGSPALRKLEAALESKPFTSGPIDAIKGANQTQANRLFAEAIGESDDVVDATVLDNAFDRIGRVFDDTAAAISDQPIDRQRSGAFLASIQDEFDGLTNRAVLDDPLVKRFITFAESGQATGRQLRNLTSKLGRKAKNQMTTPSGERELGNALFQVKDFVDDIIESGLTGEQLASYQTARQQYRILTTGLSRTNIINPSSGNVNLNALAGALRQNDKSGFLRGKNTSDLYNAARAGQAFRPIVGDSGTATRSTGAADTLLGLPANLASRVYFSQPATRIAQGANKSLLSAGRLAGPLVDPRLLSLIGANAATSN